MLRLKTIQKCFFTKAFPACPALRYLRVSYFTLRAILFAAFQEIDIKIFTQRAQRFKRKGRKATRPALWSLRVSYFTLRAIFFADFQEINLKFHAKGAEI